MLVIEQLAFLLPLKRMGESPRAGGLSPAILPTGLPYATLNLAVVPI